MASPESALLRRPVAITAIGAIVTFTTIVVLLIALPGLLRPEGTSATPEAVATSDASAHDLAIKIATGVAAVFAAALTAARLDLSRREHELSERAQLNDRFARAAELLGHAADDTKIAAIYSLEQLAIDSAAHRPTVVKVISAVVRERARLSDDPEVRNRLDAGIDWDERDTELVAAAVRVLAGHEGWPPCDLSGCILMGTVLKDAHLQGVNLGGSWLSHVDLRGGDLTGASLTGTTFQECYLDGAHFVDAETHFADFKMRHMRNVTFDRAYGDGTSFRGGQLSDCSFQSAAFRDADLRATRFDACNFSGSAIEAKHVDERTRFEGSVGAPSMKLSSNLASLIEAGTSAPEAGQSALPG